VNVWFGVRKSIVGRVVRSWGGYVRESGFGGWESGFGGFGGLGHLGA
jgi:hypothetical protein